MSQEGLKYIMLQSEVDNDKAEVKTVLEQAKVKEINGTRCNF